MMMAGGGAGADPRADLLPGQAGRGGAGRGGGDHRDQQQGGHHQTLAQDGAALANTVQCT